MLDGNGYYLKLINDVPINYYDLINEGNFGYNSSLKLLKKIKKEEDSFVFFYNQKADTKESQADKKLIEYVLKNGTKIERCLAYDIYEIKK